MHHAAHEVYLRSLVKEERNFVLARGRTTDSIPVVQLVKNARYLTRTEWGRDDTNPDLAAIRRGAGLCHNEDQGLFALHNAGIYSMYRRDLHVLNGEKVEVKLVKDDIGMLYIAGARAELVRAKDPASQQAYEDAIRLPASTSAFTRNEHKAKGGLMTAKARSVTDSRKRVNPGRLMMLISVAIPSFDERLQEVEGITVLIDISCEAEARYIDAVIGVTYACLAHVSKFLGDVLSGRTRNEANRRELAARMRRFGMMLGEIDALPFRHAFKHTARELLEAAELIEKNKMPAAAAILSVTQQSMLLQLRLHDLQEQASIISFWEKEVVAPTEEQLKVEDEELARLHKEIGAIDESNFTTRVTKDICAHLASARECLVGRNYDQVYECLGWGLEAH